MSPADSSPRVITQANILETFHEAMALQGQQRFAEAAALWRPLTGAAPQSAEAFANLGAALLELAQFDEAEVALRRAVALKLEAAFPHLYLARFLQAVGRWGEAEAPFRRAIAAAPNDASAKIDLARVLLGLGRFAEGWDLYEARIGAPGQNTEDLGLPNRWRGEPLEGRALLIWPEQGFGDQIQFARFAPLLRDRGARVTLVAPPELSALFETLGVEVVEQSPRTTLPQPDYWTHPLSIPRWLGLEPDDIPAAPYLSAPKDRRVKWAGYAPTGAIGVHWKGRPAPNPHRSLPSKDMLAPLEALGRPIVDLTEPVGDFADTAAILEQLDAVVTVDTAVAHLAGAMGKPTYLMLPWLRADWRWMQNRTDSPWYRGVRVFRQARHGDWQGVVGQVHAHMAQNGLRLGLSSPD